MRLVQTALTFAFFLLVPLLVLLIGYHPIKGRKGNSANLGNTTTKDFFWIDTKSTHELIWHSCYQPLRRECARLLVPLNHLNYSGSEHATIALIRIPSPLSSLNSKSRPHPRYRGPILFNPGGPGLSGVDLIHRTGDLFAQILGDEFDIVSFDPRGVARSTPKVSFFDGIGRGEREVWESNGRDLIRGGVGDKFRHMEGEKGTSLEETWAYSVVTNERARERAGQWLGNVNTEQTAHDLLSIVHAYGKEKLMYWGFSYGTVLGSTFASLFPDKVERIVLDGVLDADDYYAGLWMNNLLDTPKTLDRFFETCHAAGPACAFWAPSPSMIAENLTRIYEDLIINPIPVLTSTSYGILDYPRVKWTVFSTFYSPWASWPILAQALAELGGPKRDPTLMWQFTELPTFKCSCAGSCESKDSLEKEFEAMLPDAISAILCSDGLENLSDATSARDYFIGLSRESEWADIWANTRLSCSGWPKVSKGYQGPVGAKTSFPMLFIGNTADPITPVVHARSMAKRFPGSRALTQDSPGHRSIIAPSVCTLSHVKEYFSSGRLPREGTVCSVDSPPFPQPSTRGVKASFVEDILAGGKENMKVLGHDAITVAEEITIMKVAAEKLVHAWKSFNGAFLRQLKGPRE